MLNSDALKIALDLIEILKPGCLRIEVKGSICRLAAHVKDIEILAIPDLTPLPPPKLEFGKLNQVIHKTRLDKIVHELKETGLIHYIKGADKYKRFYWKEPYIAVDLFLVTPPAQWGVLSVIRTGPGDFSHWMVTRKSQGGALPDDYIVEDGVVGKRLRGVKGYTRASEISMPEEMDFFRLCEMEYLEPSQRSARWTR